MNRPAVIKSLVTVCAGALALLTIAPWLNSCIGPLRFVDCAKFEKSATPLALAPWYACHMSVCDEFASVAHQAERILVLALILAAVTAAGARLVDRRRFVFGVSLMIAALLVASACTRFIYVGTVT